MTIDDVLICCSFYQLRHDHIAEHAEYQILEMGGKTMQELTWLTGTSATVCMAEYNNGSYKKFQIQTKYFFSPGGSLQYSYLSVSSNTC